MRLAAKADTAVAAGASLDEDARAIKEHAAILTAVPASPRKDDPRDD
jgi:hypothetical protein